MKTVIKAENISKKFILNHQRKASYHSLREAAADTVKRWGRKISRIGSREDESHEEFWALKDISFEIKSGERVGIIGRNGAGKSTILKILSRITEPTEGRVTICGRVSSLLEVGTGFHPELTGRENIFLNGAVLGMTKNEIKKKFDEIVAFAEIDKFLDTPVKHYSSGMYVRLAFAVAAHLEPDILIVDEVLAVGDAQFQKKCLGKMEVVSSHEGRTVLFVSHNMAAIRQICRRALYLEEGRLIKDDASDIVVHSYLHNLPKADTLLDVKYLISRLPHDPAIRLNNVIVLQEGKRDNHVVTGKPIEIIIDYEVMKETYGLRVFIGLYDNEGTYLFRSFAHGEEEELRTAKIGRYIARATIPPDLLAPITYKLGVSADIRNVRKCFPEGVMITLFAQDAGRIKNAYAHGGQVGVKLAPFIAWSTELYRDADTY